MKGSYIFLIIMVTFQLSTMGTSIHPMLETIHHDKLDKSNMNNHLDYSNLADDKYFLNKEDSDINYKLNIFKYLRQRKYNVLTSKI